MRYLHTMIRVRDLEASVSFFAALGLREVRRKDVPEGRFTLVFLAAEEQEGVAEIELTYNYDDEPLSGGRNFGHLAFEVTNIYELCADLVQRGITINRPPRDGYMAFVRSPDGISVELLQQGAPLPPQEPWKSMPNQGEW